MSKFLSIVENATPSHDLDKNRAVMQELQQLLNSKDIKSSIKTFRDVVTITLGNSVIELELKNILSKPGEEEGEDDVISGILSTDPRKLAKNPKMAQSARKVEDAVTKVANNISTAAARGY